MSLTNSICTALILWSSKYKHIHLTNTGHFSPKHVKCSQSQYVEMV